MSKSLIPLEEYGKEKLKVWDMVTCQLWWKDVLHYRILFKEWNNFVCDFHSYNRTLCDFRDHSWYKHYLDKRPNIIREPVWYILHIALYTCIFGLLLLILLELFKII
jgi:hypothetical protein